MNGSCGKILGEERRGERKGGEAERKMDGGSRRGRDGWQKGREMGGGEERKEREMDGGRQEGERWVVESRGEREMGGDKRKKERWVGGKRERDEQVIGQGEMGGGRGHREAQSTYGLYHVHLLERFIPDNSVEGECTKVYGVSPAIQYDFTHCPPCGWRLLDPVTTKPINEHKVRDNRVSSDDGILVQRVVLVVTSPRTLNLQE